MERRILFLINSSIMGGATISLINLIKGLQRNGYIVAIAGPQIEHDFEEFVRNNNIKYYSVHAISSILPKIGSILGVVARPVRMMKLLIKKIFYYIDIEKVVLDFKPDLIHTNVGVLHEGFFIAKKYKIPHVMHLREYQDLDFGWHIFPSKRKYERMLKNANVITITEDIRRHFNLQNNENCRCIYNGVMYLNDVSLNDIRQKYFMTASQLICAKDIDLTIKAFSEFVKYKSEYKLRIFGFGDIGYIEYLKKLAEDLGCANSVVFEGYNPNVSRFMENASALIVSSHFEGFGRMTAEACLKGCLVIGRNKGGTKEILDKTGGYKFDDVDGCLKAMIDVSNLSVEDYHDKASLACNCAKELYTNEHYVNAIMSFYELILNRKYRE